MILTSPPSLSEESPTAITTSPLRPWELAPVRMPIEPDLSAEAMPVLIKMSPLTPDEPASPVEIDIGPLELRELPPVARRRDPDEPAEEEPDRRSMLPPVSLELRPPASPPRKKTFPPFPPSTVLVLAPKPPETITSPPAAPEADVKPAVIAMWPPSPDKVLPTAMLISPAPLMLPSLPDEAPVVMSTRPDDPAEADPEVIKTFPELAPVDEAEAVAESAVAKVRVPEEESRRSEEPEITKTSPPVPDCDVPPRTTAVPPAASREVPPINEALPPAPLPAASPPLTTAAPPSDAA
jgi:hypothetical protein